MKKYITIIGKNFITGGVIQNEKIYLELSHDVLIPFETESSYEIIETNIKDFALTIYRSNKLKDLKIKTLERKVAENYSSNYLEKYFKEIKINQPDLIMVNKVVNHYVDFLREVLDGDSSWSVRRNEIVSNEELNYEEKDIEKSKMFYDYFLFCENEDTIN